MALDIQSKEVIDKISEELKVQPALEIPRELDKNIKLVYEVNPRKICDVLKSVSKSNGTQTVYTVPSGKHFYLTWAKLSAEAATLRTLTVVLNGETVELIRDSAGSTVSIFTGIAPIKVDDGSIITITSDHITNNSFGSIAGYTEDIQ